MKFKTSILATAILTLFSPNLLAQLKAGHFESKEISTVLKGGNVDIAWGRGYTGTGSVIAILDNGFDLTHKDYANRVIDAKNFTSVGSAVNWGLHGTQMTGIAAANQNGLGTVGVAPNAQLLLGQVGYGGTTGNIDFGAVARGIDWASNKGATVINMSFGANYDPFFVSDTRLMSPGVWKSSVNYGSMYGFGTTDLASFAVGTARGSVMVAAAGNQGLSYSAFPGHFATQVDSTGKLVLGGRMLIVGAAGQIAAGAQSGQWTMASFSNKAGHLCANWVNATCNDPYRVRDFYLIAPGMQVYGSVPNQMGIGINAALPVNGTSPAAAYVSGGIAIMKQAWPQLRPEQLVAITLNTAKDLGAKGVDDVYGHGMVDFDAATKPMGTLVLANSTKLTGSGPAGKVVQLQGTGVKLSGAASLGASSVLKNSQVVDQMGRNYTVDLTKAVAHFNVASYQFDSPWMGFAGLNYKQMVNPIGKDGTLTVMGADNGVASRYEWQNSSKVRVSFEMGSVNEKNGFLGTQGGGALAFGGSDTSWIGLGTNYALNDSVKLFGNYSAGLTHTNNIGNSMVQLGRQLIADTWKVGITQDKIFFNSNKKDSFTVAIAQPVTVRSGRATVTGVTGYTYTDNADGTTDANPVMQSERVSLSPTVKEMNLILGYNIMIKDQTSMGITFVRQFNASGNPGVTNNNILFTVRSTF